MFEYADYFNKDAARAFKLREIYRLYAGEMLNAVQDQPEGGDVKDTALKLCKIRGLVRNDIEEKNELQESALIRVSAEGDALAAKLLLAAGADPNSVCVCVCVYVCVCFDPSVC